MKNTYEYYENLIDLTCRYGAETALVDFLQELDTATNLSLAERYNLYWKAVEITRD